MNRIGPIQLFAEIKRRDDCVTYRGVDTESSQIVLVKVFQPAHVPDEAALARFHQEAAIYASLDHPNIVKLCKFGVAESRPYLALEFVEGQNLRVLLSQRSPLPNDIASGLARSMLAGLEEIHRHGVIHRDLKPENILIGHEGAVKICDFDLALAAGRGQQTSATASRQPATDNLLSGSPGYFSPEAIMGEVLTPRSDLFAMGIIFYEMFTGTRPFVATTPSGEINAIVRLPHLAPSRLNHTIPPEVEPLIDRLLAKSPAERPESAAVILKQLIERVPMPAAAQQAQALQCFLDSPNNYQSADSPRPVLIAAKPAARVPRLSWRVAAAIAFLALATAFAYQQFFTQAREPQNNHLPGQSEPPLQNALTVSRQDSLLHAPRRADSSDRTPAGSEGPGTKKVQTPAPVSSVVEAKPARQELTRTIFVHSTPWAYLFVNGDSLGQMPRPEPLTLAAGTYQFVFKKPLFPPILFNVVVDSSTADTLFFSLWDRVAQLEIKVYPWAELYVDGIRRELSAESPIIYLLPGEHHLKFVHPLSGEKNEMIFLRARETRRLEVNMLQRTRRE